MKYSGKAHPKAGVKVLDASGKDVPVYLDGSVPVDELHMIDDQGRLAHVHVLQGSGGDEVKDAPHSKPKR